MPLISLHRHGISVNYRPLQPNPPLSLRFNRTFDPNPIERNRYQQEVNYV